MDGKKGKVGIMRKCFFVLILSLAGVMPCMGETSKSLSASDVSVLNRRGLDLLATCCQEEAVKDTPVLISPFSIDSAFALLWLGSSAPVKEELSNVLGLPSDMEGFAGANRALSASKEPRILTSNSLWADSRFPLAKNYVDLVNGYFPSSVFSFDNRKPGKSAEQMNAFVAEKTEGMITDLIAPAFIQPAQTRLVLINTLYFKGRWRDKFDREQTVNDYPFHQLDGTVTSVAMMRDTRTASYYETADYQVLALPYKLRASDDEEDDDGEDYSFVAVLPTPALDVTDLLARLGEGDAFARMLASCSKGKVRIKLPRLDFGYKSSLVTALKKRGMARAFCPDKASFPALNGVEKVSEVIHVTRIKMDEEATEAAAATAIGLMAACYVRTPPTPPIPEFTADHPYLGFIVEHRNGLVLFAGVIRRIGSSPRSGGMSREAMEEREARRRAGFRKAMEEYRKAMEEYRNPPPPVRHPAAPSRGKPGVPLIDDDF